MISCQSIRAASLTVVNTTKRSAYNVLTNTRGIGPNQAVAAFDVFAKAMQLGCESAGIVAAEDFNVESIAPDGVVIAVTENYTLPGMDFDQSLQTSVVRALHEVAQERLIVVALRDPYELADFPEIGTYLCSFSFRPCAAQAAADVLLGQR